MKAVALPAAVRRNRCASCRAAWRAVALFGEQVRGVALLLGRRWRDPLTVRYRRHRGTAAKGFWSGRRACPASSLRTARRVARVLRTGELLPRRGASVGSGPARGGGAAARATRGRPAATDVRGMEMADDRKDARLVAVNSIVFGSPRTPVSAMRRRESRSRAPSDPSYVVMSFTVTLVPFFTPASGHPSCSLVIYVTTVKLMVAAGSAVARVVKPPRTSRPPQSQEAPRDRVHASYPPLAPDRSPQPGSQCHVSRSCALL